MKDLPPGSTVPPLDSLEPGAVHGAIAELHGAPVAYAVRRGAEYVYRNGLHQAAFGQQGSTGWRPLAETSLALSCGANVVAGLWPAPAEIGLLVGEEKTEWLAVRFPLHGPDAGLVAELAMLATPLTGALEELRRAAARWRLLIEQVPDYVMTLDRDGRIQFINHAFGQWTAEEVVGMRVYDLAAPEYHPAIRGCLDWVFRTRQSETFEIVGPGVGEPACYRARVGPMLAEGKVIAAIMVATEITREKRIEELLRRTHRELEVRVRERTASLQAVNERLQEEVQHRQQVEEALRAKQRLLNHLLEASESERRLAAYEVHDGVVQYVTASLMHLEAFAGQHPQSTLAANFERAMQLLRTTLEESRRLISGLRPMILDEAGIVAAIEYLAAEAPTPPVRFQYCLTSARFASLVEGALFRICQEALTNARRHSGASEIRVTLVEHDGLIHLSIEDDGCGFDPAAVRQRTFGLEGVVQRARLLGGQATIDSAPGRGTRIAVQLPCATHT